jgi:hypothetical protein
MAADELSNEPVVSGNDSDGSNNPFDAWINDDDRPIGLEDAAAGETTRRGLRSMDDALLNENLAW